MQPEPLFSPCASDVVRLFRPTTKEIFIASAFLRIDAVAEILSRLVDGRVEPGRLRVLTRALPMDIATGASDLESLHVLSTSQHSLLKIELRRDPRLHAKAYLIDDRDGIITSANLTPSGLQTNIELGIRLCSTALISLITAYLDPIWEAAEVVNDEILANLQTRTSATGHNNIETVDILGCSGIVETSIRSGRPSNSNRRLAHLPSRPRVPLDPDWRRLSGLGFDLRDYHREPYVPKRKRNASLDERKFAKPESGAEKPKPPLPPPEAVRALDDLSELRQLIRASDWEVRDAAAEALGRLSGDEATKLLLKSLKIETDRDVLWSIILSLKNRLTSFQLAEVLEVASRYHDPEISFAAYQVAVSVEPEQYMPLLIQSIPDLDDDDCISQVSEVLSLLDENAFFAVIASQLEWADTPDRRDFLTRLGDLRGKNFQQRIHQLVGVRYFGEGA